MFWLVCFLGAVCAYVVGSAPLSRLSEKLVGSFAPHAGDRLLSLGRVLTDIAKGFAGVTVFCTIVGHEHAQFGALFVYIGHLYPLCPKCHGGNGIGLLLGAMVALHPMVGLIALLTWMFTYYVYRYATVSALVAAVMTPVVASMVGLDIEIYVLFAIAVMIFVRLRLKLRVLLGENENVVVWRMDDPEWNH